MLVVQAVRPNAPVPYLWSGRLTMVEIPKTCGKCPQMGGIMCLDKRITMIQAMQVDKRQSPPTFCPIRKEKSQ